MNMKKSNIFWGLLLIVGGGFALAQQLGYIKNLSPQVGMYAFAVIAVIALVMYALSNWREWGWLFPAGVFGGLAVTAALAINKFDNPAVGSPLFFGLLIPFVAAYLTDRARNWWALIPGAVMLFLALTTLLVENVGGEWVGSLFLFLIALSFFVVYLNNRTRTWALLVAYIMFVLSIAPAMASGGELAAYYGAIFLLAVALPFFIVYFRSIKNWWAIIPAGVMTTLAVITGAAIAGWIKNEDQGGYVTAVLLGGFAATFAVVWLRHAMPWAKIVTIVLAVLAVGSVLFASYTEVFWPLAIILVGAYLLFTALRPKAV
ncbi:MAG: hypothetical protein IPP66_08125 [Anaerolineales bacterium]|nr:hypothetical protein [Anaerolineales bacterium]